MQFFQWWLGRSRNGRASILIVRWLTVVLAAAVTDVASPVGVLCAQDSNEPAISRQGFEQGVPLRYGEPRGQSLAPGNQFFSSVNRFPPPGSQPPSPGNQFAVPGNQFSVTGIQFVAYQAPAPQPPGPTQESPLDSAVRELQPSEPSQESPLDRAIRELGVPAESAGAPPARTPSLLPLPQPASGGGAQLKLVDISLDGLFAAGTSTAENRSLQELEGGGHDPRKRGFTVRGVELSMMGAVDPYFDGEMHLVNFLDPIQGDTVVELEEAFMTTRSLPNGLQLKAGQYLDGVRPDQPDASPCLGMAGPADHQHAGIRPRWYAGPRRAVELAAARRMVLPGVCGRCRTPTASRWPVSWPTRNTLRSGPSAAGRLSIVTCIPLET